MAEVATARARYHRVVAKSISSGDLLQFKLCGIAGADVDSPLMIAVSYPPQPASYKEPPRPKNPTILVFAILCEQPAIIDYILEVLHPDPLVCIDGFTAIHYAAMLLNFRPLQALLKHSAMLATVNCPVEIPQRPTIDGRGTTALHLAVSHLSIGNVCLLAGCADVNAISTQGNPPLFLAVRTRFTKVVEILVAAGADRTLRHAESGQTAADLAAAVKREPTAPKKDCERILEILRGRRGTGLELEELKRRYAPDLFNSRFAREKRRPEWVDLTEENLQGLTTALRYLTTRAARIHRAARQKPDVHQQEAHQKEEDGEEEDGEEEEA
jgi:hypothetical protein